MTSIPPMRPPETGSTDVEPAVVLRGSSPVRTAAAIAGAAAVFLAVVVLAGVGRLDTGVPGFLEEELGPEKAGAPLDRTPATGVGVRINDQGYTVSHWGVSLSVASEDVGGAKWRRHVHGATRETEFGTETIVVNGSGTEEFLTVVERQGEKTWRWKLASRLYPRLAPDGSLTFLDPTRHQVTSISMDPVRILDKEGKDVTPDGLRWDLEEGDFGWFLTLKLDDADLPLPYVIDPAVTHRASLATSNTAAGTNSLLLTMPGGVQPRDMLVAALAVRGDVTITAPAGGGWTLLRNTLGTNVRLATYYKVVTGTEPASYTWTFGGSQRAVGGISAFYGVRTATTPLDQNGLGATGTGATTATASSVTTTAANDIALAFYASATGTSFTQFAGPPAWAELYDMQQLSMTPANRSTIASATKQMPTAGATNAAPATIANSSNWVAQQAAFFVDNVNPTATVGDPGNPLVGTVNLAATADDVDSYVASVQFQRSPAGAGTWTDIGAADVTAPYSISFDTTSVANGLYDLRAVATDLAGNTGASPVVDDVQVANPSGSVGSSATVSNANNGATTVVIPVPAGTQDKDLLVAHVSTRGGTGTTVTPAGRPGGRRSRTRPTARL